MKTLLRSFSLGLILFQTPLFSQPGSPDATFNGGIVLSDFNVSDDYANAIALQSDGKTVVVGYTYNGSDNDFSFIRLNADGTPDNTFDSDGELLLDFGGFEQFASSVAIQSDGKIVAAGTTHNGLNNDIMVVRLNSDGTPDNSFDGDGIRIIDIGISVDYGRDVTVQPDGKIVVIGSTDDNPTLDFAVLRLNSDGSFDNTFDSDGLVLTDIDGYDDYARSVTIQTDGKIIVAGYGYTGADADFVAARYNTDGSLDISFNFDGKLFTDFGGLDDIGNSVAVHTDGTIVISGYSNNSLDNDFAAARYLSDGTLDTGFDTDGKVITNFAGFEDQSFGCGIFSNGMIVLTGSVSEGGPTAIGQVVYETDGSLATSFDTDGKIVTYVMNETYSTGIAIQPDQKFVVCGHGYGFAGSDLVTVRYNGPDGCTVNTGVTQTGFTLTANAAGLTYQWVDCNDGFAAIPAETNQAFTATSEGTYAVIVTDGLCSDTSACFDVICNVNTSVTQTGFTLTANTAGLTYQWVDCNNGFTAVPGETSQTFTATTSGNYAVIITDGACSDTSACFLLDDAGIQGTSELLIAVYPNPVSGVVTVQPGIPATSYSLILTDIAGRTIYQKDNLNGTSFTLDLTDQPKGIYILEVFSSENTGQIKLLKE